MNIYEYNDLAQGCVRWIAADSQELADWFASRAGWRSGSLTDLTSSAAAATGDGRLARWFDMGVDLVAFAPGQCAVDPDPDVSVTGNFSLMTLGEEA